MPRDCVYQLRLTRDEKDRLASMARARDLSIAGLIRAELQLDVEVRRVTFSVPVQEESAPEIRTDSQEETAEASLVPLARQLQNQGYTKPVAERMARKKLGLS